MTSRQFWSALTLAAAANGLLVGCEAGHGVGLRPKDASPSRLARASEVDEATPDEPGSTKGFFKPTRRRAALSSEASEIENSLGLGNR